MRRTKKAKCLIAGVLFVVLALPAAVFAYFTDYESAYGGAILKLEGETELQEEASTDKKVISVKNIGETDVVVRLAVYGDYIDWESSGIGDNWSRESGDDWFYYDKILHPDESTSEITVMVDKKAAEADGHDFNIVVVHESERVAYDGTEDNKVKKPDGWTNMPTIVAESSKEVGD